MDIEIISKKKMYNGYAKVEQWQVSQNGQTKTVECVQRGQSVAVLPYDRNTDSVLVVSQFRPGAIDQGPSLIEMVAGMIDEGETAEQAALRETIEEVELALDGSALTKLGRFYLSPGISTETTTIFLVEADLSQVDVNKIGGLVEEGEQIRKHLISPQELRTMLASANGASVTLALAASALPL
ncbi:NUDIX domain-containing protein [Corallincola spongiicola]|uniref:ADP-ribose pyrophosphatase n=1 Tax=Corallincola spongiicola TaxID=2520508 RepID=A0ABY1WM20_9GAMM|nr:NUDIX hydrolase [Corallincola spongiicola]TAA42645.1 NUDIX hydrolase [Corallincola spongiicola]